MDIFFTLVNFFFQVSLFSICVCFSITFPTSFSIGFSIVVCVIVSDIDIIVRGSVVVFGFVTFLLKFYDLYTAF